MAGKSGVDQKVGIVPVHWVIKSATPKNPATDWGYLRLRREDYTKIDIEKWAQFAREQKNKWSDVYIYFKHEEAGIGPRMAKQTGELLD